MNLNQNVRTTQEQQPRPALRFPLPIAVTSLTTTGADIFVNASDQDFFVEDLWFANVTGLADSYTLHIVPSGGTAATANMYANATQVAGRTAAHVSGVLMLSPGDTLHALCGTNNAVNVGGWGHAQRGVYG